MQPDTANSSLPHGDVPSQVPLVQRDSQLAHAPDPNTCLPTDEKLVRARLGVFSGLFYALRAKHPPSAAHGLRVSLGCSKWAGWRKMDEDERSLLEVAALLHDVGKIGVPDNILQKPAQLDSQEQLIMATNYDVCAEMLRGAGASQGVIDTIRMSRVDCNEDLESRPLAARMLAIVDAFDSMTCEQIFRPAVSLERAIDELFAHAGTQFDEQLVTEFVELIGQNRCELEAAIANRWLVALSSNEIPGFGEQEAPVSSGAIQLLVDTLFHRRMLESLDDAAVYMDASENILIWNRAAEDLTGRQGPPLIHRKWTKEIFGLLNKDGEPLSESECPIATMKAVNAKVTKTLRIGRPDGRNVQVNVTVLPVLSPQKALAGAILLVRDSSAQEKLEQRVQSLNEIATHDPLTKVANRAKLDQELPRFLEEHNSVGLSGSLIICDIDHFKKINDTHGHQAGDDALVTFASILREVARDGDLVARFGGEEFIVLCGGADNPTATSRAEELRRVVERTPVPSLNGRTMTASFGVTEIQPGDTQDTLLARADRALLNAKETGRNRVVQLGAGQGAIENQDFNSEEDTKALDGDDQARQKANWLSWFDKTKGATLVESELLASVPQPIALQKLAGFVNDHKAEVMESGKNNVVLRIHNVNGATERRRSERVAVLLMEIEITPVQFRTARGSSYQSKTQLAIKIRPVKPRDRRVDALKAQATQLLISFSSYLVTQVITEELRESIIEPR